MSGAEDHLASPACSLSEADDLYRGFLPLADIQAQLQRWAALAPNAEIASALHNLAAAPLAGDNPPDTSAMTPLSTAELCAEITALLPKIRDDVLHGQIQALLTQL